MASLRYSWHWDLEGRLDGRGGWHLLIDLTFFVRGIHFGRFGRNNSSTVSERSALAWGEEREEDGGKARCWSLNQ